MKFRTEIQTLNFPFSIEHGDKIIMTGSCFSDNIGKKLAYYGFDVLYNPFGVVYNPFSIADQLNRITEKRNPAEDEFFCQNGIWQHFDFHSSLGAADVNAITENIAIAIDESHDFLKKSKYLFITLGTSIVYKLLPDNRIVANNHKFPSGHFSKHQLSIDQIISDLKNCFTELKKFSPELKFVLNVSPVRHIRDGLIENQRSKARLIIALEELCNEENVYYFPSYEILIDDLRDYRFYGDDLIHPSVQAVDYIWEKLSGAFFNENTLSVINKIDMLNRALLHRPFFPDSAKYLKFRANLDVEIKEFQAKYPNIIMHSVEELRDLS